MTALRHLGERIAAVLFPRHCPLCGTLTEKSDAPQLCPDCQLLFSAELMTRCPVCRYPAPQCRCTPDLIADAGTRIGGRYFVTTGFYQPTEASSVCNRIIYRLKRDADDTSARILARMLSREVVKLFLESGEDVRQWVFTYPPRTKAELQKAGFDQAERLARLCAENTGARYLPLFGRRGGEMQKSLDARTRLKNAKQSLVLRDPQKCRGLRVILCDDVLTSGATMAACAEMLREAGAKAVFFAAAMKTAEREYVRAPKPDMDWFRE